MKKLLFLPLLCLLCACSSGGDAVQELLPDVPPVPDTQGEGADKTGETVTILQNAQVPDDVPKMSGLNYLGKHDMKLGEDMEFKIENTQEDVYFDLEITATKDMELAFGEFFQQFDKSCADRISQTLWMEVDTDGYVLAEQSLGFFDSFYAYEGSRYILRNTYENAKACEAIRMVLKVQEK
ncbi:MAG: hypothetical protein AAF203_06995 [Pseudomonadota bacterium]